MTRTPLHVVESWPPVASGYANRSWQITTAQQASGRLSPWVVVSSRQESHGVAKVDCPRCLVDKLVAIGPSAGERRIRKWRRYYVDHVRLRRAIDDTADRARPDLIQAHFASTIGSTAAGIAARRRLPFVAEVRFDLAGAVLSEGLRLSVPPLERVLRAWFERHLSRADAIVAASYSLAGLIRDTFPALAERVVVVPNAINSPRFAAAPARSTLRADLGLTDAFVVGSTGRQLRYEGLDILLAALARLRRDMPNVHGLLIGSGPQHEYLRGLAKRLAAPVTFVGPVSRADIADYYRLFDVFMVPRRDVAVTRYASPLKVVEALSAGRPVVATAVGDIPCLLADGRGVLLPAGSPDTLAAAIARLARRPDERRGFGERAAAWATRQPSWAETADCYAALYERILESRAKRGR